MAMDKQERRALRQLRKALERFRQYDPEMQVQTMLAFVSLAVDQKIPVKDLVAKASLSRSQASRQVATLGREHWRRDKDGKRKAGHDLVVAVTDPMDARQKLVTLTPRGKVLRQQLVDDIFELAER